MLEMLQRSALYLSIAAALFFPSLVVLLAVRRRLRTHRGYRRTKQLIVEYLHEIKRPITSEKLAENMRLKRHLARTLLRELVQEKRVQRLDNPHGIDRILYQVPDARVEPAA